jgi:membrane-bound lytic murein transglycosylase B
MTRTTAATALLILSVLAVPALAQEQPKAPCGGDLSTFLDGVRADATAKGIPAEAIDRALASAQIDKKVLSRDRGQGVFRQTFLEFSKRTVSQARLDIGRQKIKQYADTFAKAEADYGVPAPVITAFWAMETDFGAVQGDFNTRDALVTLAHDCRRPELFRPQLLSLIEMVQHGDLDPDANTGAGQARSARCRCCPGTSSPSVPTATATAMST